MSGLKVINKNNQLLVESRDVAELIEKEHSNLMRDIRGYVEVLKKSQNSNLNSQDFFIESTYQGERRKEKCFLLTRKGCDMVANKMTGEKGILFTAIYVTKFESMENKLKTNLPTTYKEALIH
ncbi:phage regulatory, Rha family protein [[Clostridium] sordellii ATCC 9714]|nr:phage regulatory, Rha family protein [[Clostridium] sordellii ATCC 9714] [Paeniclostridium sordellii ATCC 9714]